MFSFDRKIFFDKYRAKFGRLSQKQVDGLNELLDFLEADPHVKDLRHAAYMLATVKIETADTFKPIHEYGSKSYFIKRYGGQTKKGKELGNDTPDEGYYYAGKGYPQTTGESNYEKAEAAIRKQYPEVVADFERRTGKRFDLTVGDQPGDELDPQNILDPAISYATMSYGMRTGMFTGKKLSDYIKGTSADYKNARRIINGTDRAAEIAEIAKGFAEILRACATAVRSDKIPAGDPTDGPTKNETSEGRVSSETPEIKPEPNPPPDAETTATEATVKKDAEGGTTVEVTAKNEQDVHETATIAAPEPQGLKKKLGVFFSALFGGSLFYTALEKIGAISFTDRALILLGFVVFLAFLGAVFYFWIDAWKQNERVKREAEAKTAVNKKDIEWV